MSKNNLPAKKNQDVHSLMEGFQSLAQDSCCSSDAIVGTRLRALRQEQHLSIRTLASRCGISTNTLSLIENDRTSPSVHTLQLLARGLGVPLAAFFEVQKPGLVLVYQQQDQRPLIRFANGTIENLGEGVPPLGAEPVLVTLESGESDAKDIRHAGREFIYCLEGRVTCVVAGQEYPLSPGDSLLFDANAPHHWLNASPGSSRLLVLFCPMEARDQPAERHLDY